MRGLRRARATVAGLLIGATALSLVPSNQWWIRILDLSRILPYTSVVAGEVGMGQNCGGDQRIRLLIANVGYENRNTRDLTPPRFACALAISCNSTVCIRDRLGPVTIRPNVIPNSGTSRARFARNGVPPSWRVT